MDTQTSAKRPCNARPAQNVTLRLRNGESEDLSNLDAEYLAIVTTEVDGVVRIPVMHNSKIREFRFSEDFLTVSCDRCQTVTVTLPPELSAKLVVAHNDYDEIKKWLEVFSKPKG